MAWLMLIPIGGLLKTLRRLNILKHGKLKEETDGFLTGILKTEATQDSKT
ncbi:MAG: hypothetical protein IPO04_03950 [Cytophagaceae bacterium]|nr:hypothetical protein [Cytophagaceae bacterium]